MQTFLPYPSVKDSVECLDNSRLGKQRVEAQQIFNVLIIKENLPVVKIMVHPHDNPLKNGWHTHTVVRMWGGYPVALLDYAMAASEAWRSRGKVDNLYPLFQAAKDRLLSSGYERLVPLWFGDDRVHISHRANLVRKDPEFYGKYSWGVDPSMPYFWPV